MRDWNLEHPMDEFIEIEGGQASLYRRTPQGPPILERRVPLPDLAREITAFGRRRDDAFFLPTGVRFVRCEGALTILAVEQPPQVRRLLWSEAGGGMGEYEPRRLAFPYIVYLLLFYQGEFEEMRIYYRQASLTSPKDELFLPNLMNVQVAPELYSNCRACVRGHPEDLGRLPMAEQVEALLEYFWTTGFNADIEHNGFERAKGLDPRIASVEAWEEATITDPLFPLEVTWESTGCTLEEAADRLVNLRGGLAKPLVQVSDLADLMYRIREIS